MQESAIPHFALRWLTTFRQQAHLAAAARMEFDRSTLASVTKADASAIFTDPRVHETWERDIAAVRKTLPTTGPAATDEGERRAIYYIVSGLRPQTVLEVGTHRGASTLLIAAAQRSHVGPGARLVTIDLADANATNGSQMVAPRSAAAEMGLADAIRFEVGDALAFLRSTSEQFDLIFLDGSHAARDVYCEVSSALARLRPGGAILLHDYHPGNRHVFKRGYPIPGPYLAIRRIEREGHGLTALPLGELPWRTRRGDESATCLAFVVPTK